MAKAKRGKVVRYNKWGYIFLIPFVVVYVLFQLIPLFRTFYYSFFENYRSGLTQIGPNFIGFGNYAKLLSNPDLWMYTKNTLIMWVLGFVPQIIISLLLGAWFSDPSLRLKGQRFFKTVIYLPNLIMASAFAMLFFTLFSDGGPINEMLMQIGILKEPYQFLTNVWSTRGLVALMNFLMWFGNTTILLMAGMMGIDTSLFEAAEVDGATSTQVFFKITLPLLKPILIYVMITSLIGGLQMFEEPKLLFSGWASLGNGQTGGPGHTALTTVWKFFNDAFSQDSRLGYGSAMAYTLFVIIMLFSVVGFRLSRGKDGKGE